MYREESQPKCQAKLCITTDKRLASFAQIAFSNFFSKKNLG
jgi:hypothetical protein